MKSISRQKGVTAIGWVLIIALVCFVGIIVLKLIPVYIERFNVASIMRSLENDPTIGTKSPQDIILTLNKRFRIDMVTSVTKDDIYITHQKNMRVIELDYEVRKKIFGNHDIVVSFLERIEVPSQ